MPHYPNQSDHISLNVPAGSRLNGNESSNEILLAKIMISTLSE